MIGSPGEIESCAAKVGDRVEESGFPTLECVFECVFIARQCPDQPGIIHLNGGLAVTTFASPLHFDGGRVFTRFTNPDDLDDGRAPRTAVRSAIKFEATSFVATPSLSMSQNVEVDRNSSAVFS